MPAFRWPCALIIAASLLGAGCHRGYYRRQADAEVYALIRQKANDPRWDLPNTTIEVMPQSRMHDPFSADHPPLPPDDPASAKLMQVVDDKPGYPLWHANGDTDYVENPEWMSFLPVDENGVVIIDSQRAVELALTHSPLYQRTREELYLTALDVSLERFGFDTQMLSGRLLKAEVGADSSTLGFSPSQGRTSISRLGTTGAEFMVSLANSIVWQFSGADTQAATNLISFSLLQPLLRGAGRDVILESLTQAERSLLANVRQFERFRQGFFLLVTSGRSAGTGLQRLGNFLNTPPQGTGNPGGLLGLLSTQQSIRIREFNVVSLRNVLNQFKEFLKAERIDSLQLTQVETTLYNSERQLLQDNTNYQTQLDLFKQTLGLPPDLRVEIRDTFLRQFELIDNENNGRQFELNELKVKTGDTLLAAAGYIDSSRFLIEQKAPEIVPENAADPEKALEELRRQQELELTEEFGIRWTDELRQKIEAISPLLDEIMPTLKTMSTDDVRRVRADIEKLRQVRPRRTAALALLRAAVQDGAAAQIDIEPAILEDASLGDPDRLIEDLGRLETKLIESQASLEQLKQTLGSIISQGDKLDPKDLYFQLDERLLSAIPKQLTDLASLSLELSLVQARARTDSIELASVDLESTEAIKIARCCRVDWMNARASLVNSWRQIEIVADQLESGLDLEIDGSVGGNPINDNHPFRILSKTGRLSAGLRFDSPITRLAERNNYREQLIQYQRDRRLYYQFEDETERQLRSIIRNIELNKILFELQRRSIKVSVQQVELARFRLEAPPRVQTGGTAGTAQAQLGATTARDLTDALNGLQTAQTQFLDVWVRYEVLRRDLDFDLGTMQLADDGFWIDPGTIDSSIGIACGANMQADQVIFPETPSPRSAVPVEIRIEPMQNPDSPSPALGPQSSSALQLDLVGSASTADAPRPEYITDFLSNHLAPPAKPLPEFRTIVAPNANSRANDSSRFSPAALSPAGAMSSSSDLFMSPSRLSPDTSEPGAHANVDSPLLLEPNTSSTNVDPPAEFSTEQRLPTFDRLFGQPTSRNVSPTPPPANSILNLPSAAAPLLAPEIIQSSAQIPVHGDRGTIQRTVWNSQVIRAR